MDKHYINIIIIRNNTIEENILVFEPIKAENIFLEKCNQYLSNFDKYTKDDIDAILGNGYEKFGNGGIFINWPNILEPELKKQKRGGK